MIKLLAFASAAVCGFHLAKVIDRTLAEKQLVREVEYALKWEAINQQMKDNRK